MTEIAQVNWTVRAGNSGTVENEAGLSFRLLEADGVTPRDLTGATLICRIADAAGVEVLRKTATVDLLTAGVESGITVAESRTLATAQQPLSYELERRQGADQRTEIGGAIFTIPGVNDD